MEKILWITPFLPFPPISGGKIAIFNKIKGLYELGYKNYLISIVDEIDLRYLNDKQFLSYFEKAIFINRNTFVRTFFNLLKNPVMPYPIASRVNKKVTKSILTLVSKVDIIFLEFELLSPVLIDYADLLKSTKVIITIHGLGSLSLYRLSKNFSFLNIKKYVYLIESYKMKFYESLIFNKYHNIFDYFLFLSKDEEKKVKEKFKFLSGKTLYTPIGIDLSQYKLPNNTFKIDEIKPEDKIILFSGSMTSDVNIYAVRWFIDNVFPKILSKIPTAKFIIVGINANRVLKDFKHERIKIFSDVEDMKLFWKYADLCVIPLKSGAGVKLKLLEALACKKLVVSTKYGVEGTEFKDGIHLLIADDPDQFSRYCIEVLNNPKKFENLKENAWNLLSKFHDYKKVVRSIKKILKYSMYSSKFD